MEAARRNEYWARRSDELAREYGAEEADAAVAAELARRQAEAVADYRSTNGAHVDPRDVRAAV